MKRQALVVGINQYPFGDNLTTPATAAEKVSQLLEKYGDFEVHRLPSQEGVRQVDPEQVVSLEELEQAILQLFQPKSGMIPETALLFFAGHGLQRERNGEPEGFLITSDAVPGEDDGLFSLKRLRQLLQESPVRQQIVWLDCCYSGELFNFAETDLGEDEKGRDRCFIAASREFQVAYGQEGGEYGELTGALLQGLDPTWQPEKWVTNYSLVDFVKQTLKDAPQHPICTNSGGQIILTGEQSVISSICPYRGLTYFDFNEEDPKYFYGRTALTNQLLEKVRSSNFLAVLGASGSGKSSVVRAGLLYQLYLGKAIPGSDRWQIYPPFAPGEYPLRSLEQTIGVKANQLAAFVKAIPAERVVLVIDQFEEIFTECREEKERQQFIRCLMSLVERQEEATHQSKIAVVLVMRSDFQGKCDQYAKFASLIDQNLVRVTQMSREELKEAITKPAQQVGLEIDRELVTQMIADVEGSPGDLPLLQYTLTELWQHKTLNRLVLSDYTRLGGVKQALGKRANEVYQSFSKQEQLVAKRIFLELTRLGEEAEDTRKQVRQQDLVNSQQSETLVNQVVQRLANANLVVTGEQELDGKRVAVVNIAHEALIRNWQQLRNWLKENRETLLRKQDIEDAAKEWRDKGKLKDSAYLLQGRRLAEAENFQQSYANKVPLSVVAQEFVQESVKEKKNSRIRTSGIVATIILVLSGATGFALIENNNNRIRAGTAYSQELLVSGKELEALVASIKVGRQLKQPLRGFGVKADTRITAITTLQQLVYKLTKRQQLTTLGSQARFSHDGQIIATANSYKSINKDKTIQLWNRNGELIKTLEGHNDNVNNIRFIPDGKVILSSSCDGVIKLWTLEGTLIRTLNESPQSNSVVSSIECASATSFSSDGKTLAVATNDGTVKVISLDGNYMHTLSIEGKKDFADEVHRYGVSISPDGQLIAVANWDNTITLWNRNGKKLKTFTGHTNEVSSLAFSPDGKTIVSGSYDTNVKLWNINGNPMGTLKGHTNWINSVAFSPNGEMLASASDDKTVKIWSLNGTLITTLQGHNYQVLDVSFSPDSKVLASTSSLNDKYGGLGYSNARDNNIILWNFDIDDLLFQGCNAVESYLKNTIGHLSDEERHTCDGIGASYKVEHPLATPSVSLEEETYTSLQVDSQLITWRQFIEKAKNNPDSVTFYGNSDYELPNEFKDGFVYIIHGATWQGVYILKKGLPDYPSRKAELNEIDEKIAEHYIKSGKAIKLIWNLSHNSFVNYRKNTEVIFRDGTGCLRTTCLTAPFLSNAEISRILYSEQAIVKKDR
jgi:WD40 repeat protein